LIIHWHRFQNVRARGVNVALGLAFAAGASACSGEYAIGNLGEHDQLLGTDAVTGSAAGADGIVSALLAPADVTLGLETDLGAPGIVAAVGDLDGDGFGDMAVSSVDYDTNTSYVHVRYGGTRPQGDAGAFAFAESGARLLIPMPIASSSLVVAAGDVDGDSYGDFLIVTTLCQPTLAGEGAYLIYGGPERLDGTLSVSNVASHFVPPQKSLPDLGCQGSAAPGRIGDLDGDGLADLVLTTAPSRDPDGEATTGGGEGTYIFYGSAERRSSEVSYGAADATLHADRSLSTSPLGDIDGDGLADLLLGDAHVSDPLGSSFLLAGRRERLSGAVDLATTSIVLQGAELFAAPGDLDGDGLSDVLLRDADTTCYLFYGAPGVLAQGVDFTRADATLPLGASWLIASAGDRDGDGDVELLDVFAVDRPGHDYLEKDVALIAGRRERLSGSFAFPESTVTTQTPEGRFPSSGSTVFKTIEWAFPAGDLDGDGAGDLFSVTNDYVKYSDDGGFFSEAPQLGIHYGTPVAAPARPR
jgi:hypothetical protein